MTYTSHSPSETHDIARKIAATLTGGNIMLLRGDLGAGKTTFTKGIAEYFGIKEEHVVSPTFTLIQEYRVSNIESRILRLVHVDTYRLEHEDDLIEIGIEDYLNDDETVCIIEWPEKMQTLLANKKVINISIDHIGDTTRTITVA